MQKVMLSKKKKKNQY